MAQLKKGGFGGAKMFTADDLKDLSPEQMSEKVINLRQLRLL